MDLLALMAPGWEDKALDRLEGMIALFEAEGQAEQGEALERAMNYCEREWGSYQAGLDALAKRIEARATDPVAGAMQTLRLREEGGEPGSLIQAARARRARSLEEARPSRVDQRRAIIARYGSEAAAKAPTAFERIFIDATQSLVSTQSLAAPAESDDDGATGPLDGWQHAWHELPAALRQAVSAAHPLPAVVAEARAECLRWEQRLHEIELLFDCPGDGTLPTACAARRKVVEQLWRSELPARSLPDMAARIEYWAGRGGDDGTGYRILAGDLLRLAEGGLAEGGLARLPSEASKERARRLKAENPGWSLARIGRELGISRQAVHKHLRGANLGYKD